MFRKQTQIQGTAQRNFKTICSAILRKETEGLSNKKKEPLACPICKCEVRTYTMKRHEESIKHQMNINGHFLIQ